MAEAAAQQGSPLKPGGHDFNLTRVTFQAQTPPNPNIEAKGPASLPGLS